jgi:2-iminobutanoate/2-iminopropanoate deaminase
MTREAITSPDAPAPVGPFSQAIRSGGLLFLSGLSSFDPALGAVVDGGIEAQTRFVFANAATVLRAAGATFDDVVKVNIYLTNLDDFAAVNAVYAELFREPFPARTTIGAAGLPLGAGIEIELVAEA